jgi:hypothetical protein
MPTKIQIAESYVSLMIHLAKSDGVLDQREDTFIHHSTKGYLKRFGVDLGTERVAEMVTHPISIEDCILCLQPLEVVQKRSILMQLVILVYIDGTYSKEEKRVLEGIIKGLFRDAAHIVQKYIEAKLNLYAVEDEMSQYFESVEGPIVRQKGEPNE